MAVCSIDKQWSWGTGVLPVCAVVDAADLLAGLQQVQDPGCTATLLFDLWVTTFDLRLGFSINVKRLLVWRVTILDWQKNKPTQKIYKRLKMKLCQHYQKNRISQTWSCSELKMFINFSKTIWPDLLCSYSFTFATDQMFFWREDDRASAGLIWKNFGANAGSLFGIMTWNVVKTDCSVMVRPDEEWVWVWLLNTKAKVIL